MKKYTLFLFLFLSIFLLNAQNQDSIAINRVIDNLFLGMRNGDSALVHNSFHENVKLETAFITKNGETVLKNEKLKHFLKAVGTPHKGTWNEKILQSTIQIDQIMAHVWADYEFFVDDKFIHCGVNSFQLVKLNNKWKIIHLIDTRRRKGCKNNN